MIVKAKKERLSFLFAIIVVLFFKNKHLHKMQQTVAASGLHKKSFEVNKQLEFSDNLIELKQMKIAEKNNFILKEHVMTIYGVCETCQK